MWRSDLITSAALASAYLQRLGRLPRTRPTIADAVGYRAARRRRISEARSQSADELLGR